MLLLLRRQIFPSYQIHHRAVHQDSVPAKIKERRRLIAGGSWKAMEPPASSPGSPQSDERSPSPGAREQGAQP